MAGAFYFSPAGRDIVGPRIYLPFTERLPVYREFTARLSDCFYSAGVQ